MPRPKKVTVEKIEEIIRKMKRMKVHQAKKKEVAKRSDGQPIYHYSSISKAKIAKALSVNSNYLTSLQKENDEIACALKYVGQSRASKMDIVLHGPKIGTKAYLEVKIRRQSEKITKLERQAKEGRSNLVQARKIEKAHEELLDRINSVTDELKAQKKKNNELESVVRGLQMTNASLNAMVIQKNNV